MSIREPVIHAISHPSQWPEPVLTIAQTLHRVLLPDALTPPCSHLACEMYANIKAGNNSYPYIQAGTPLPPPSMTSLNDVLDILLSTAALLRRCHPERESTSLLYYGIMRILGHALGDEFIVMEHTPFTLPNFASLEPAFSQGQFDAIASALLCTIIRPDVPSADAHTNGVGDPPRSLWYAIPDDVLSVMNMGRSDRMDVEYEPPARFDHHADPGSDEESSSDSSDEDSYSESHSNIHPEDHPDSESDPDSHCPPETLAEAVPFDAPFDAHMLPGCGPRTYAIVPFVVVGTEDTIVTLMASALFHRFVFGIDQPVIGIVLPEGDHMLRVVLGWLEHREGDPPLPHVALSTRTDGICPELGIYEMTNPWAVVAFAQFIIGSYPLFSEIRREASEAHYRNLPWRSDGCSFDDDISQESTEESLKQRVHIWLDNVYAQENDVCEDSVEETLYSWAGSDSIDHRMQTSAQIAGQTSGSASSQPGSSSVTPEPSVQGTKAESMSKYCEHSLWEDGKRQDTLLNWLADRGVICLSFMPSSKVKTSPHMQDQVNMYSLYEELTKPSWPHLWKATSSRPGAVGLLESITKQLFSQYDSSQTSFVDLEKDIEDTIIERLSFVLDACLEARNWEEIARTRQVKEIERRGPFDRIMQLSYVTKNERCTQLIRLEEQVYTSRNKFYDTLVKQSVEDAVQSQRDYLTQRFHVIYAETGILADLRGPNRQPVVESIAELMRTTVLQDSLDDAARSMDPHSYVASVKHKAATQPYVGICDALLAEPVSVPVAAGKDPTPLSTFHLIHPQPFPAPADQSASGKPDDDTRRNVLRKTRGQQGVGEAPMKQISLNEERINSRDKAELRKAFINPIQLSHQERVPLDPPFVPNPPSNPSPPFILIPTLTAEYKKLLSADKALKQHFMYLVSQVQGLASIGVYNFPVFGLLTNGPIGAVSTAWHSGMDKAVKDKTFVICRQMRTFDLREPLDCYCLAVFLIKLRAHQEKSGRMQQISQALERYAEDNKFPEWAQRHQFPPPKKDEGEQATRETVTKEQGPQPKPKSKSTKPKLSSIPESE